MNRFGNQAKLDPASPATGQLADYRMGMLALKELSQILGLFDRPVSAGQPVADALTGSLAESLD